MKEAVIRFNKKYKAVSWDWVTEIDITDVK
jgi:hypothetical protein